MTITHISHLSLLQPPLVVAWLQSSTSKERYSSRPYGSRTALANRQLKTTLLCPRPSSQGPRPLYSDCLVTKVNVTMRLAFSQSVSLGVEPQIFIPLRQLRSSLCGAPSLTRGRVCLLYMLLALASVVFLQFESLGTRDHICLRFETSLFVAYVMAAGTQYTVYARTAQKPQLQTALLLLLA
jgi:hypothetical protein